MTSPSLIRDVLSDRRGVIAPVTAVVFAVLLGMVGLVTDAGVWFSAKRDLQAATDAAALGSAKEARYGVGAVAARARIILVANGQLATDLVTTEVGYYCPSDAANAVQFRAAACPGRSSASPVADSVRLRTTTTGSIIFSRLFTDAAIANRPISVTSTAALINEAGLRAGTGVAALNGGIANGVLSALTGGTVSLNAVHYQGLLNANIDGITLLNSLAVQAGVTAGTYGGLLQSNVSATNLLDAAINALSQQNQIADTSAAIAGLRLIKGQITGSPTVNLGDLFGLGMWQDLPIGQDPASPTALHAGVNAYQLATLGLQLANGNHAAAISPSGLNIPGLANITIESTVVEPPVEPVFGFGPVGTSVHTAQVRTKVTLDLLDVGLVRVALPLYIEAGGGDARLTSISCPLNTGVDDTSVGVTGSSSIADVWLGDVAPNAMTNFSTPVTATSADLATVGGGILGTIRITGLAHIRAGTPTAGQPAPLYTRTGNPRIGQSETGASAAVAPTAYRFVANNVPASIGAGLAAPNNLNICASILGGCILSNGSSGLAALLNTLLHTLVDPVLGAITSLLSSAGLNSLIDGLLQALGIQPGYMDVFVTGARCGIPVLVE